MKAEQIILAILILIAAISALILIGKIIIKLIENENN